MIILKFTKVDSEGRYVERSVSCETVEITHCIDGYIVAVHPTLTKMDVIEYRISTSPGSYRELFIVNKWGKTIDRYKIPNK